jgi:hypothetical protein
VSDERFEREIRDALVEDEPGAAPSRLWTRVAAIPDEAPRRDARPMRAIGLLAAAAVVIAAVAIAGLSQRGETVGPPASPSPSGAAPSASAPAVSPSASASPVAVSATPAAPTTAAGPFTVDPSMVQALPAGVFALRDGRAYTLTGAAGGTTVSEVELATGRSSTLVRLANGHRIASPVLTTDAIVWLETWYGKPPIDCKGLTPCNPYANQPILWAINAVRLADNRTTQLASGSNSRVSFDGQTPSAQPPAIAADGDRVAYAIDILRVAGAPEASLVIVRTISTGAVVRQVNTSGYVAQVGLAGEALFYREAQDVGGPGTVVVSDATLMVARSDAEAPRRVGDHVSDAVIGNGGIGGDTRVAWAREGATGSGVSVAPVDTLVATPIQDPDGLGSQGGTGGGRFGLAIEAGGLGWITQIAAADGSWSSVIALCRPGGNRGNLVVGTGEPDAILSGDGMLIWSGPGSASGTSGAGGVLLDTIWSRGG